MPSLDPLPVDPHVGRIVDLARQARAVVVTAAPGAGKTTRIPPALTPDGAVMLLQPRRIAARAIARRIAWEQGWTVGREVGWHVRFDRHTSAETRLVVATEGILTARLQQDPLATDVRTIVIDEFHERSLYADVALALSKQAWMARRDLRLIVMSATLDAARVSAYLEDCPIVEVPGRSFPLEIAYRPSVAVDRAVADALPGVSGAILCFLAGASDIRRAAEAIGGQRAALGVPVLPLYGGLDAAEQDAALQPSAATRIILATNLAETTLTVPDVACVIDTGLQKVARYDADRGIDSLETERVSQDSADQRAGRAGRTRAGTAVRLWDPRDRLHAHREPEIHRVDLAATVLDVLAWGGDPRTLGWFEPPPPAAIAAGLALLARLGAVDAQDRLTETGRTLQRLPLHPRLARILLGAHGAPAAARACALLAERRFIPPRHGTTPCDVLSAIDREDALPAHVRHAAAEIRGIAQHVLGSRLADRVDDDSFRRAMFAGYPDRVARRRAPHSDQFVLSSGSGARLARESGVQDAEFIVAVDVSAVPGSTGALIRLATRIEREWLTPTSRATEHEFDADAGVVRASRIERYDALTLASHPVPPDPVDAARLLERAYRRRGPSARDEQLLRRLRFAGIPAGLDDLLPRAAAGARRLDEIDLERHLESGIRRALAHDAPAAVPLPGGREGRLDYRDDGRVVASVRLQQVFGLAQTPRVGPQRRPVTFELLAPNGRPVQVTDDLPSFWSRVYPELRPALRARYPKHKW